MLISLHGHQFHSNRYWFISDNIYDGAKGGGPIYTMNSFYEVKLCVDIMNRDEETYLLLCYEYLTSYNPVLV